MAYVCVCVCAWKDLAEGKVRLKKRLFPWRLSAGSSLPFLWSTANSILLVVSSSALLMSGYLEDELQ